MSFSAWTRFGKRVQPLEPVLKKISRPAERKDFSGILFGLDPHRVDPSESLGYSGIGLERDRSDPSEWWRIVFYS